jgi:hypothetical protein
MGDAKFKLEDILNKQKAPPQILDLVSMLQNFLFLSLMVGQNEQEFLSW